MKSPTYELEHEIDHSVSYLRGLVESFIAGKELDYNELASKELSELEQQVAKLHGTEVSSEEKQEVLDYLSEMIFILREVGRNVRISEQLPGTALRRAQLKRPR